MNYEILSTTCLLVMFFFGSFAKSHANSMVGEIKIFAGNFAPRGWALCDGQLLPISQNSALFSLLGTPYGGDGRTTFALPDLRGRAAVHAGKNPASTKDYRLGSKGGSERNLVKKALMAPPKADHTSQ